MLTVDRETADVLRTEAKKVAMFEHDLFEDFLDFSPGAQHGLALRYRDVFDLIDALGWDPDTADPANRLACGALDRLFNTYTRATRTA